jgi:hypothetical protein
MTAFGDAKWQEKHGKADYGGVSDLWLPSQNGGFLVALHMQKYSVFFSETSNLNACSPVPLCEPSQKG